MLRYAADLRSIAYLTLATAVTVLQWKLGTVYLPLYAVSLFLALATAIISHNHNHLSMWKSKPLNVLTGYWISFHYGHPTVAWIPTHNQGHHLHNNREADASHSPKLFKKNHLAALLVYPQLTSMAQTREIKAYFRCLWRKDKGVFVEAVAQYVVFFGIMVGLFLLDWRKALLFVFIPQQFALFVIQVFNYVQHIEADPESRWNHSRNFLSPVLNFLLLNNGFHTVHHQKPGLHWSQTPAAHAQVEMNIDPRLKQRSFWGYMVRTFIVPPRSVSVSVPAPAVDPQAL